MGSGHRDRSRAGRGAALVGLLLHALLLVPGATLGLVAPAWAIAVYYVAWLALLGLAFAWLRTRPWLVLAVPALMMVFTLAMLSLGESLLGWTA